MFTLRTNLRVCLQITEFHWTLYDPVHQDRVKKALLYLFEQVEEKVPEKAEFKRHLDDFLKGRFATGSLLCCVPWEQATQRYDDGKELLYYHSGKPDGLKVPKPAGTSAEDEDEDEEDGDYVPPADDDAPEKGDEEEDEDEDEKEEPPSPEPPSPSAKGKNKRKVDSPAVKGNKRSKK